MHQEGWEPLHWIIMQTSILYDSTWTYSVSTSHSTCTASPQTRSLSCVSKLRGAGPPSQCWPCPKPGCQSSFFSFVHSFHHQVLTLLPPRHCLNLFTSLLFQLVPRHFTSSLFPYSSGILSPFCSWRGLSKLYPETLYKDMTSLYHFSPPPLHMFFPPVILSRSYIILSFFC